MRVIGGILRSRLFNAPKGKVTHPMGERIRGALFNSLGNLSGMRVLDTYAGSGGLSFEAISRGARQVVAIDRDVKAHKMLVENVAKLGLGDSVIVHRANSVSWSKQNAEEEFDIVLCDPPYNNVNRGHLDVFAKHVNASGIMVLSHPVSQSAPELDGLQKVGSKNYGEAVLTYYKH